MMLVLGIETSCDETSAAVVRDGREVLSNVVATQYEVHRKYGGVVPELASRRHAENIYIVTEEALQNAGVPLKEINAIAVTRGPGLLGALLVGLSAAKGMAWAEGKPLIPVNHLHGHLLAASLTRRLEYPFLGLAVSGGHTSLYHVKNPLEISEISSTRDDAAGEAFDKAAKMMGLGFPGGPAVEKEARKGNPGAFPFSVPNVKGEPLSFSFSGLKTAVRNAMERSDGTPHYVCNLAASFQATVVKTLVTKTVKGAEENGLGHVVLAGGVACNKLLRTEMQAACDTRGITVEWPEPEHCTDNGAMIACAGYHLFRADPENRRFYDFKDLDAKASLPLGS